MNSEVYKEDHQNAVLTQNVIQEDPETEQLMRLFQKIENENLSDNLLTYDFVFARFFFQEHPINFKTLLVKYAKKFKILARAAKKIEKGTLGTVFECFGRPRNIISLERAFEITVQFKTLSKTRQISQPFFIDISNFKNLPRNVKNFLLSTDVIEETPEYMRRQNNDSDRSDVKEHFLYRLIYGGKYYVEEILKDLKPKIITKGDQIQYETSVQVVPKIFLSSLTLEPFEVPLKVECRKIGELHESFFFMNVYPTEPPTTVFSQILHVHPGIQLDEILIFNQEGDNVRKFSTTEQAQSASLLKFFYYFRSDLQKFEKANPKIAAFLNVNKYFYYLCILAGNGLNEKKLLFYSDGLEDLEFYKVPQQVLSMMMKQIKE